MPEKVESFNDLIMTLARYPEHAHHPTCVHHGHHIIHFRGSEYCLGCSSMNIGTFLGVILFLISMKYLNFSWPAGLMIGFSMYLPTLIQIKFQWKPFKILSRTLLGIGTAIFLLSTLILTPLNLLGFVVKLGGILFFISVAKITLWARAKYSRSPCDSCSEGTFPFCSYKLDEMKSILKTHSLDEMPAHFLEDRINTVERLIYPQSEI